MGSKSGTDVINRSDPWRAIISSRNARKNIPPCFVFAPMRANPVDCSTAHYVIVVT